MLTDADKATISERVATELGFVTESCLPPKFAPFVNIAHAGMCLNCWLTVSPPRVRTVRIDGHKGGYEVHLYRKADSNDPGVSNYSTDSAWGLSSHGCPPSQRTEFPPALSLCEAIMLVLARALTVEMPDA